MVSSLKKEHMNEMLIMRSVEENEKGNLLKQVVDLKEAAVFNEDRYTILEKKFNMAKEQMQKLLRQNMENDILKNK